MNELQMMPGVKWVVAQEETPTPVEDLVGAPTKLVLVPTKELVDTLVADDVERIVTGEPRYDNHRSYYIGIALSIMWILFAMGILFTGGLTPGENEGKAIAMCGSAFVLAGYLFYTRPRPDDQYVPWLFDNEGSYAASRVAGMCSPSRNTLTGRNQ